MEWLPALVRVVGWLILVKAAMGIVTGWGLLQREEWARVVALVFGFLALLSVPIGTALGIYTLWVLLPSQSESGSNSVVECDLAKVEVAGSNPVSRSRFATLARAREGLPRRGGAPEQLKSLQAGRGSQVVRQRSAKPLFGGSIPTRASKTQGVVTFSNYPRACPKRALPLVDSL
jgi:hypothetical protein